jgi:hypothetical protein
MAVKDSGSPLAISEIVAEFGGSTPHSLSEYYAGGGNVPSGATGQSGAIPTSGTISMSQFYGSTARVAIALQISSTTQNYNIYANRGGTYSAGISDVTLTVQAVVGSSSSANPALDTGNQWATGDTVKIINNNQIVGHGGTAGAGGGSQQQGFAGGAGGNAINLGIDTTIQNNGGFIRGAGGGGGGGGFAEGVFVLDKNNQITLRGGGGGGGGGAGQNGGSGGAGGVTNVNGQAGQTGSISGGGAGGVGGTHSNGGNSVKGGNGGGGGGFGQGGATGQAGSTTGGSPQSTDHRAGGSGGAAGKAINLNGNSVTYEDGSGNVQGAVS